MIMVMHICKQHTTNFKVSVCMDVRLDFTAYNSKTKRQIPLKFGILTGTQVRLKVLHFQNKGVNIKNLKE